MHNTTFWNDARNTERDRMAKAARDFDQWGKAYADRPEKHKRMPFEAWKRMMQANLYGELNPKPKKKHEPRPMSQQTLDQIAKRYDEGKLTTNQERRALFNHRKLKAEAERSQPLSKTKKPLVAILKKQTTKTDVSSPEDKTGDACVDIET